MLANEFTGIADMPNEQPGILDKNIISRISGDFAEVSLVYYTR